MTSIGDPGGSAGRRLFRDAQLPPLVCGEEETLVSTRGRFARQGGPMFALTQQRPWSPRCRLLSQGGLAFNVLLNSDQLIKKRLFRPFK